jgi:hypothetical protein
MHETGKKSSEKYTLLKMIKCGTQILSKNITVLTSENAAQLFVQA